MVLPIFKVHLLLLANLPQETPQRHNHINQSPREPHTSYFWLAHNPCISVPTTTKILRSVSEYKIHLDLLQVAQLAFYYFD